MGKGGIGKLTRLKSVLKKVQSFKLSNPTTTAAASSSSSTAGDLHPVYVGKSRRRYLISSDVMDNPLFRELIVVVSSGGEEEDDSIITVDCEVVLFDHLLWMLQNADPQPESTQELLQFYTS